jgi:hypothetical protein
MSVTLSIFIGISLLIVAIAFAIRINFTKPIENGIKGVTDAPVKIAETVADFGKHAIDRASDAFTAIFQSRINIVSSTTVCDATPIAELAVLQRNIREIIDYQHTSFGSTKRIIAEQTFVAKIGFDLAARFSMSCDPSNKTIKIFLPEPKILSLETSNPEAYHYLAEDGWINKLAPKDHQQILIQLKDKARKSVDSTLAVRDAKQLIETRFNDLFRDFEAKVIILFSAEQPKIGETS